MRASVVVPCLNEAGPVRACLESLAAQDLPAAEFEVLVVDGGSRDDTQQVVRDYIAGRPNMRLLVEPTPGVAAGRNAGIAAAAAEAVAFLDADCTAPPRWLSRLLGHLDRIRRADPAVVAVGGGNVPPVDAPDFVQAVGVALDSFAGSFTSVQGRAYATELLVPSLATCNALYCKAPLLAAEGFDASLRSEAEDADLNHRLGLAGHRLAYVPDCAVAHNFRATPRAWLKNMFRYGKGRARLLKRHPGLRRPVYLLPLGFAAAMAALPLGLSWPAFLLPLAYFPAVAGLAALQCARKRAWRLVGLVGLVYCIQHFGYAFGEAFGLLNPKVR